MLLTLRYHETAQRPATAAFLRGADPAAWLRELSRWQLPAAQLACYLVPESIRSVRVAGLFVVAAGPLPPDVLEPYGPEADGRLYVPVGATLGPATAPGELAGVLLWPRQLLHPGIGLVGFETADELDLTALLDCPAPRSTDWSRARPGHVPKPGLWQVRVLPSTVEEVVQEMQEEVGTVPLAQLPGLAEDRAGPGQASLDNLRRRLLKALLAVVRWLPGMPAGLLSGRVLGIVGAAMLVLLVLGLLLSFINWASPGNYSGIVVPLVIIIGRLLMMMKQDAGTSPRQPVRPAASGSGRPGPFQRLERWLGGRVHDLEQKRQNEIERLLKLFGENLEEALKYAIPLGGPYQDRGRAPESARLGRRSTDFNLGGLGGGGRVDAWNLDAYRGSLSQQYRAAATQEIKAGRSKKAAYIYAHLLGDYLAAANTLEQGGFCREAAALYRDHLHNKPAAARCLENGGLLLEAAELYADLKEHEKAGDLHQRLAQPALAARHYERGVALLLGNDDHPAAARLLAHKLADAGRAQEVLLQGWAGPKQPEVCLRQYFDLLAATPETDLSAHVRTVFAERTPPERRVPLLRVLATLTEKHPAPALLDTSRDIAYDVVSTEAAAGNLAHLSLLRHFLPDDRLLAADCGRFLGQPRPPTARPAAGLSAPSLDPSIRWKAARTHRHQWVAVGVRDERLHLARGNWYGQVEYYSWMTPVPPSTEIMLVADELHGPRIILRSSERLSLETKYLPKNKYFAEALTVACPSWLPPWPARVCLLPDGATATARLEGGSIVVERYSAVGQPFAPFYHVLAKDDSADYRTVRNYPAELFYRHGTYYSYWRNWLICWSEDGRGRTHKLPDGEIMQLVPSPYAPKLQLVIGTEEDVFIWEPTGPVSNEPLLVFTAGFALTGALQLVGPEHLVVFEALGVVLLHWEATAYDRIRLIELESTPIAVLATRDRQQFAVLEDNGRITLHSVGDEG